MILFSWNELPTYGAKLIGMAAAATNEKVCVIATRPKVPVDDLEKICGAPIIWVDKDEEINIEDHFSEAPSIFFQAGWYVKAFISIGSSLNTKGVPVVLLSDNSFKKNIRQFLGRLYFRFFLSKNFNAVWVPGKSGRKFMLNNGVNDKCIYDGLYGSDEQIFMPVSSPETREKVIIFAGRLVFEKGIIELMDAFKSLSDDYNNWRLEIYGNGPLLETIIPTERIKVSKFVSAKELAKRMGEVKIFCLPSHSDHWPLVINEAALAGCGLLISDAVGNSSEFCSTQNSKIFKTKDVKMLRSAMAELIEKTEMEPELVVKCSTSLGSKFDRSYFPSQFIKILNEVRN
jgi:glycosyltransferase involved in cell wall biosynthesis